MTDMSESDPNTAIASENDHAEEPCEKTPAKKAQRLYPPEEPVPEADPKAEADPEAEAPVSAKSGEPEQKHHKKGFFALPKTYRVLLFVLLAALIGTACGLIYVVANTANMRAQLRRAQSDQTTAVENVAGLETQIADLQTELEEVRAEAAAKADEITTLTSQIASMESSVTQNAYDKESAQRQLEEAQTQITSLNTKISDLETQLSEAQSQLETANTALSAAEEENKTLSSKNSDLTAANAALTAETEFYDSYVVFVMTTATDKYYHKYDCPSFTQKSFLAYSTKLAESNGYSPCPTCVGTSS